MEGLLLVGLVNELNRPLTFVDDHNVHGKPMLITSPIPAAIGLAGNQYYVSGMFATEKRSGALVGTQYGFTVTDGTSNYSFGVECPLTSIYEDNNCWCGINTTSQNAANETAIQNVQEYTASEGGINLSIRCNSGSGSVAYYVARVYE